MMRTPPPIRIQLRYSRKNWPAALNEAPRLTNTAVNPAMKASECSRIRERSDADTSDASRSTDMPVTNERYDGKSGSTQGDRNEKSPAENATTMPRDSPTWLPVLGSILQQRLDVGEGGLAVPGP